MQLKFLALAFILCLIFTPIIRYIVLKLGWIAHPTKDRWHKKPTALFGGIAIYLSCALPLIQLSDFKTILFHVINISNPSVAFKITSPGFIAVTLLLGISIMFFLGLCDDFLQIKPQTKLIGQILAASLVSLLGVRLHWFSSLTIDTIVTIVWIVGITNSFNLIDNMDGLCSGIGCIAAITLAVLYGNIHLEASTAALILAGSTAGFLIYNFNPATIFMGDCGSLLIGFYLSILTLFHSEVASNNTVPLYAVPILILMVPIFDTTMVTCIRLLSGRKASTGGKDHTSHRLVLMGHSERVAVLFLYFIGVVSGISGIFVNVSDTFTSPIVIISVLLSVILMGIYLAQIRVYPQNEFVLLRNRPYTPILIEITYKRQLFFVILDFCLVAFSYYISYRLRFNIQEFSFYFNLFLTSLPTLIVCKFISFWSFGIYKGIWYYMSITDVFNYLKASFIASLLSVSAITFIYRFTNFSKGIFIIDFLVTTGLLLGTRGSFRLFVDILKRKTLKGEKVFIYGAGRGGELLLREILNNKALNICPVGFIDDDLKKLEKNIQGYPVLGTCEHLETLHTKHNVSGIIISFQKENCLKIPFIKDFCRQNDLFLKQFVVELEDIDLKK